MITNRKGSIFDSGAEALVNSVNCGGIMGAGLALSFKEKYPDNYLQYKCACKINKVAMGKMFTHSRGWNNSPAYIINFPTKDHWSHPSKVSWIKAGVVDLKNEITKHNIRSIAVPLLGAGLGRLNPNVVRDIITVGLWDIEYTEVFIYEY